MVYLITGKRNSGKTHYARALAQELRLQGYKVTVIDGDEFRLITGNKDFSDEGRIKNLTDAAIKAQKYEKEGHFVLLAFVAPKREWRYMMRGYWKESRVIYIPGGTLWKNTFYEHPEDQELR